MDFGLFGRRIASQVSQVRYVMMMMMMMMMSHAEPVIVIVIGHAHSERASSHYHLCSLHVVIVGLRELAQQLASGPQFSIQVFSEKQSNPRIVKF